MNTYKKIINHFGEDAQIDKSIEELRELENELCLKEPNLDNITQEIADVLNMIIQLMIIFKISWWKIIKAMIGKNKRTLERIKLFPDLLL